jgi:hypothetical protein
MSLTLLVVVALAALVGVALGMLGGGGSIMMVPLLVYVAGVDKHQAIAMSLFVVGVTSLVGVIGHVRAARVRWGIGLTFGAAGVAGAVLGGLLGSHLPGDLLLGAFAVMMLATSFAMIRGRREGDGDAEMRPRLVRILLQGFGVGLVAGTVGAGGGFLIVPAMVLLAGLPMAVAVGTSLVVLTLQSLAGFVSYAYLTSAPVAVDWKLTLLVSALAVVGSLVGAKLVGIVPGEVLRRGFGWFVLVLGALMLAEQVPGAFRWVAVGGAAAFIALMVTCSALVPACPMTRRPASSSG